MLKHYLFLVRFFLVTVVSVFFRRLFRGRRHPQWSLPYECGVELIGGVFNFNLPLLGRGQPPFQPSVLVPPQIARKLRFERTVFAGQKAEVHTPHSFREGGSTLLYLHGGGYVACTPGTHRELVARLALESGCRAIVPEYRKATRFPYPAALEDALAAYQSLLDSGITGDRIFVGGDSAGGGLTLALSLRLRELGLPQPRALLLLSPWVDLEGGGASMTEHERYDYLSRELTNLGRRLYAGGVSLRDPLLSPIHADLRGLPEVLVQHGGVELFASEDRLLVERLREAGVKVQHEEFAGMVHVFQTLASVSSEARAAIRAMGAFVQARRPEAALPAELPAAAHEAVA